MSPGILSSRGQVFDFGVPKPEIELQRFGIRPLFLYFTMSPSPHFSARTRQRALSPSRRIRQRILPTYRGFRGVQCETLSSVACALSFIFSEPALIMHLT